MDKGCLFISWREWGYAEDMMMGNDNTCVGWATHSTSGVISWRMFGRVFELYSVFQWPANGQASALAHTIKFGTSSACVELGSYDWQWPCFSCKTCSLFKLIMRKLDQTWTKNHRNAILHIYYIFVNPEGCRNCLVWTIHEHEPPRFSYMRRPMSPPPRDPGQVRVLKWPPWYIAAKIECVAHLTRESINELFSHLFAFSFHTYCLTPPLDSVPTSEQWFCPQCEQARMAQPSTSHRVAASARSIRLVQRTALAERVRRVLARSRRM